MGRRRQNKDFNDQKFHLTIHDALDEKETDNYLVNFFFLKNQIIILDHHQLIVIEVLYLDQIMFINVIIQIDIILISIQVCSSILIIIIIIE